MIKKATINDINIVMEIINDAKKYLKSQNSLQWNQKDGYPTESDMMKDINNGSCYLYIHNSEFIGTLSIITTPDENYDEIDIITYPMYEYHPEKKKRKILQRYEYYQYVEMLFFFIF